MAAPNLINASSIYGKTIGALLGTTVTTNILTCPSNKVLKINTIIVSNIDGTNAADVTVRFHDDSTGNDRHLAKTISVPADSTLVVISKDTSIYLEEGDEIRAGASASSDLEMVISYEEIDDA